jgi:hypothetical protein
MPFSSANATAAFSASTLEAGYACSIPLFYASIDVMIGERLKLQIDCF